MPCVRNLSAMWTRTKPSFDRGPLPNVEMYNPASPASALPAVERWTESAHAKRVIPKFILENALVTSRCVDDKGELCEAARTMWPLLCEGHNVYWRVLDPSCRKRNQAVAVLSVHVCVHATSQPLLEDHRGPLVLIITCSVDESAKWIKMCRTAGGDDLGLVVHDAGSGTLPAIPAHRRADIVIGTPQSLQPWFATGHYDVTRIGLVVVDHPEVVMSSGPDAWTSLTILLARVPAEAQHVYVSLLDRFVAAAPRFPPHWDAVISAQASAALLFVASERHLEHLSDSPDTSDTPLVRATKQHRAEADDADVLLWNIRADDDEGDSLEECVSDMGTTFDFQIWPWSLSSTVCAATSWEDVLALIRVGAVGLWPPAQGGRANASKHEHVALMNQRSFNGHPLLLINTTEPPTAKTLQGRLPCGLLLRNLASPDELRDAVVRTELIDDISVECERFGAIASVATWVHSSATGPCFDLTALEYQDTARLVVVFHSPIVAARAHVALHGRPFDGKRLHSTLVDASTRERWDPESDDSSMPPLDLMFLMVAP